MTEDKVVVVSQYEYDNFKQQYEYLKMIVAVLVWQKGGTARIHNPDLKIDYRIDFEPFADNFYVDEKEDTVTHETGVLIKVYQDDNDDSKLE